jgi:hypothetical protein
METDLSAVPAVQVEDEAKDIESCDLIFNLPESGESFLFPAFSTA